MKAKYYAGITVAFFLLAAMPLNAQRGSYSDYRGDDAKVVVNNYYDNYDYGDDDS